MQDDLRRKKPTRCEYCGDPVRLPIPYYDIDGREITDALEAGRLMESRRRDGSFRIGSDHCAGFWVTTVWLGLNHQFFEEGPPLIFETMIFVENEFPGGEAFDYQERYSTLAEAKAGHARALALVKLGDGFETEKIKL